MRTFFKGASLIALLLLFGAGAIGFTPNWKFWPDVTEAQVKNEGLGEPHQKCVKEFVRPDGQIECYNADGELIAPKKRIVDSVRDLYDRGGNVRSALLAGSAFVLILLVATPFLVVGWLRKRHDDDEDNAGTEPEEDEPQEVANGTLVEATS